MVKDKENKENEMKIASTKCDGTCKNKKWNFNERIKENSKVLPHFC